MDKYSIEQVPYQAREIEPIYSHSAYLDSYFAEN